MPYRIHVLPAVLRDGGARPIVVDTGRRSFAGSAVEITGPSRLVYDPERRAGGTRAWIETSAAVLVTHETGSVELPPLDPGDA